MYRISELEEIMDEHTVYLVRLAFYYTKDLHAAEDIVQDVFIKFFKQNERYEERGLLKAYLKKVTVNKSLDYLRSWNYRKVQFQNKLSFIKIETQEDSLILNDENTLIGKAILELPLKQREALIYYYFEEWTIAEISDFLLIPKSTVKTRLRKGKELLRSKLEGIEWEVLLNE